MARLVARSTPDRCVVSLSPTRRTEHFGFPPSAPQLGNQRSWYVQPCLCDWAYKRSRATYQKEKELSPGGQFPLSFIHQVIIITGLNKLYNCIFSP